MVGKGTLLVILGFTILFGAASQYWSRAGNTSAENFLSYYNETAAHSIAISAANLGASQVYANETITSAPSNMSGSFLGGSYKVVFTVFKRQKQLQMTASGTYPVSNSKWNVPVTDSVKVIFGPNYFSSFGVYAGSMGNLYWLNGDTVWGSFSTNGSFNVKGSPVFYGRVTSRQGIKGGGSPIIYGSYQKGVSIPMPPSAVSNVYNDADSAGRVINNPNYPGPFEVYMTLNPDTTAKFHTNLNAVDTTVLLSSFAPDGVIFVNNGNLHIHGTESGQITVAAGGSTYYGFGNVYIDGNIMCNSDPMTNAASADVVGIVAQQSAVVESDNAYMSISPPNPPVNPVIEAAIYAKSGNFNCFYTSNSYYKNLGSVTVYGSVSGNTLGLTTDGTYGYKHTYKFDPRFSNLAPPSFPVAPTVRILSWYE